jgi:hypothetical protein
MEVLDYGATTQEIQRFSSQRASQSLFEKRGPEDRKSTRSAGGCQLGLLQMEISSNLFGTLI